MNLVVFKKVFERFRRQLHSSRFIMAEGKLQIEGIVIHVVVDKVHDLSVWLKELPGIKGRDIQPTL